MQAFREFDADGSGSLDADELRGILFKFDILMEERHFQLLLQKIDEDGDGDISCKKTRKPNCVMILLVAFWALVLTRAVFSDNEFLKFFSKGQAADKNLVSKMSGVPKERAILMIRDKIEQRIEGGPAGPTTAHSPSATPSAAPSAPVSVKTLKT